MLLSPKASTVAARLVREIAGVREERNALRLTLHGVASLHGAEDGAIFLYLRARDRLHKVAGLHPGGEWDEVTLRAFFRNEKPRLADDEIMVPVRAGARVTGVCVLRHAGGFARGAGREATEIFRVVGGLLGLKRGLAMREAETAIARAIFSGVKPRDMVYRIFHVLRRRIDYNHGCALLARVGGGRCRVLARQVAWARGKSHIVGWESAFPWDSLPTGPGVLILKPSDAGLAGPLEAFKEEGSPAKEAVLLGLLRVRGEVAGVIELSASRPNFFVDKDTEILSRFLPYMAWCLETHTLNEGDHHE